MVLSKNFIFGLFMICALLTFTAAKTSHQWPSPLGTLAGGNKRRNFHYSRSHGFFFASITANCCTIQWKKCAYHGRMLIDTSPVKIGGTDKVYLCCESKTDRVQLRSGVCYCITLG